MIDGSQWELVLQGNLTGLRYHTYAGDDIAISTTEWTPGTEITQTHTDYDVPCQTSSCLENLKYASWYTPVSSTCLTTVLKCYKYLDGWTHKWDIFVNMIVNNNIMLV